MNKKLREKYVAQLRLLGVKKYYGYHKDKLCKYYNCVLLLEFDMDKVKDKHYEMYDELIDFANHHMKNCNSQLTNWAQNHELVDEVFQSPEWFWAIEEHMSRDGVQSVYKFKERERKRKEAEYAAEAARRLATPR